MSAEDLAIDVGIPVNTEEFDTFVSCVENIIDHGCGYSSEVTMQICEKCEASDLPIAKKVLRECRRTARNTSRMRPSKLKWWQTWRSKREGSAVPHWPGRAPSPPKERPQKRPMSPMFNKKKKQKRPMSPMFNKKIQHKRPMSPMFDTSESPVYERRYRSEHDRGGYGHDSTNYRRSEYDRDGYGRSYQRPSSKKRRRYR